MTLKKERRERTGSWRLHNRLLAYQAVPASFSSSIIILDLTYYYKNYSLSKWKTIDYLPKKIESPTYEKRSQIKLNQVTLQRHNDSRVGISPPSEPDVKVSLIRLSAGESPLTASLISSLYHIMGLQEIPEARSERPLYHTFWLNSTLVVTRLTIVVRPAALAEIITLHSPVL